MSCSALVEANQEAISLDEAFRSSRHGRVLGEQIRFEAYKPDELSPEDWVRLLGADVSNLKHLRISLGLCRAFLKYCENPSPLWQKQIPDCIKFSDEERRLLLITAISHDWAESVIGDLLYDRKTETQERQEELVLMELAADMSLPSSDISSVISILGDRNSKLGKAFNAIERIGYVRTALNAICRYGNMSETAKAKLVWLSSNVLGNQIVKLVEYTDIYPPVLDYLLANRDRISRSIDMVNEDVFMMYSKDQIAEQREKFYRARNAWSSFMASRNNN